MCRLVVFFLLVAGFLPFSCRADTSTLPPYPRHKGTHAPDAYQEDKARRLYELTRRENGSLRWDDCLALKAFIRARRMVSGGYFEHRDPNTGKNPAWQMVAGCYRIRYAGENLVKGDNTAEAMHEALMESPTHRKNILNPKYDLVGIGCYDYICVQLFAGF
jgi:uncharacterized protein YkwD